MSGLPILNEDDNRQFTDILENFLRKSGAGRVVLASSAGYRIVEAGNSPECDALEITVLASNAYNALKTLCLRIGETELKRIRQDGRRFDTLVIEIDDSCFFLVVHAATLDTARVDHTADEAVASIATQLTLARSRAPGVEVDLAELDPRTADTIFLKKRSP